LRGSRFFGNPFCYFAQRPLIKDINATVTLQARLKRVMRRCTIVGDKPF
jgi:hypothetical protein